jgi:hypothetical protein
MVATASGRSVDLLAMVATASDRIVDLLAMVATASGRIVDLLAMVASACERFGLQRRKHFSSATSRKGNRAPQAARFV